MKTYERIKSELVECSIPIKNAVYDEQAFGSWYIEIKSKPAYRIVHDGRDKTIVLEVLIKSDWSSLAFDKTKSGRQVINELKVKLNDL